MIESVRAMRSNQLLIGVFCVLLATLGLSLKAIFIKLIYLADPSMDGLSILVLRFLVAAPLFLLLLFFVARRQQAESFKLSHLPPLFLLGGLGFYLSAILDFSALAYVSASLERLILFLYPTFVVLISMVFRPMEVTKPLIIALLISYFGVVFVFVDQFPMLDDEMIFGSLLVFAAAVVFAIYTVASVTPIKQHGSVRFTTYAMFAASIVTVSHGLAIHGMAVLDHGWEVYGLIVPMAVFSTVLPLILMAEGIKRIGASASSVIATSGPVITISLAYMLLDEKITIIQVLGGAMIIFGVLAVARKKDDKATVKGRD